MTIPPTCPRPHRGWDHPPPLDVIPAQYGGGWSCPGIAPDGTDCGYHLAVGAGSPVGAVLQGLLGALAYSDADLRRGLELTEPAELTRLISAARAVLAERDTAKTCPSPRNSRRTSELT
jgi:hypothetical protein